MNKATISISDRIKAAGYTHKKAEGQKPAGYKHNTMNASGEVAFTGDAHAAIKWLESISDV